MLFKLLNHYLCQIKFTPVNFITPIQKTSLAIYYGRKKIELFLHMLEYIRNINIGF